MKDYNTFDILGPIMIGPSSSHTAGAARLSKIAADIAGEGFYKVIFYLHGSFAETYEGHGTDKALVAGILGMIPSDNRLRNSLSLSKEKNIDIEFIPADLGYEHPNTVKILFRYKHQDDFYVMGSSIGGGNILITDINGIKIEFSGDYPTIILKYIDKKGVISKVSSLLLKNNLNIATMKVTREKTIATMVVETDTQIHKSVIEELSHIEDISYIKFINPIKE